jgi:hypothetical protein
VRLIILPKEEAKTQRLLAAWSRERGAGSMGPEVDEISDFGMRIADFSPSGNFHLSRIPGRKTTCSCNVIVTVPDKT